MYNCEKFKKFMHDKNLGKKDLAEELSVNPARIDELCRGKELLPLLDRIYHKYNVSKRDFYGDYIEPEYMKQVRMKIAKADSRGATYAEMAEVAGVNKNVIRDIVNHTTFSCSDNIANKIINSKIENI